VTVRGTVALAAVLAVLAGYLVLTRAPDMPAEDDEPRLTAVLDHPTAVEIVEAGRTVRVESGFDDLVAGLASLQILGVIDPDPSDPSLYGFGADAVQLRVLSGTEQLVGIEIGAMNPAETGLYVRRFGNPRVLLVGALLRWELEKVRRVASATTVP
jgi:uncharacterized protein DUF4340